jgi:hypothetical protein
VVVVVVEVKGEVEGLQSFLEVVMVRVVMGNEEEKVEAKAGHTAVARKSASSPMSAWTPNCQVSMQSSSVTVIGTSSK